MIANNKVLLIHANIYGLGGAENHCVRVADILLRQGFDVTVLHAGGALDEEKIFKWSGIRLPASRVRFIAPPLFRRFPGLFKEFVLLQYALVLRYARKLIDSYVFIIGTYGEVPIFAKNLIQSAHVPLFFFDRESLLYLGFGLDKNFLSRMLRICYVCVARLLAGWNPAAVSASPILTNSEWTARQFRRHYPNCNARAIYHGANTILDSTSSQYLDHNDRENSFVILGRVVPGKRVETAIEIIERLRNRGHCIGLHIIGNGEGAYCDEIKRKIEHRPYIIWHKGFSRLELEALAVQQKWAIHCAQFEHYGLAAIELQRLGCITFVHDSGGQAEVVSNAQLKFQDVDDAVEKIHAILIDKALACALFLKLNNIIIRHTIENHQTSLINYLSILFPELPELQVNPDILLRK